MGPDIHGAWKAFDVTASNGLSSLWNEGILVSLTGAPVLSEESVVLLTGDEVSAESSSSSSDKTGPKSEVVVRSEM